MQVIAIQQGYYGKLIEPEETFEVEDGEKASWFVPTQEGTSSPPVDAKKKSPPAK